MPSQDFSRTLATGGQSGFSASKMWFARLHLDLPLVLLLLALACTGLLVLYSGSGRSIEMVGRQSLHFLAGFTVMLVLAQLPPRAFQTSAIWFYGLGVLTLTAVLLFGTEAKGAQRWLSLPGLPRFQPSELMKLALPMTIAWFMAKRPMPARFKDVVQALVLILIPTLLILKQPDLGTAILICATGVLVIFFAGLSWTLIISMVGVVAAITPVMWMFVMHDYQKRRVLTFLDPENDPLGSGWNIIQSKTAIGSGGIQGKGWLLGSQSHLEFLPESHTDFIIAVLAEELGLIGVLLLLCLYLAIVLRALYLASQSDSLFGKLLAASLAVTFFIYVFVNIGMVSGILPVVGVPLPLVSYGGTSVISLLAAFGVLMSMCTHNKK
ncbi:MAG: hypothetical protein RL217_1852 [Pseudomonadota bacterium]|jgi:rod shape determining protein RodA